MLNVKMVSERYIEEVYRHMWAKAEKLRDPAVFRAALVESGLPADRLRDVRDAIVAKTTVSEKP